MFGESIGCALPFAPQVQDGTDMAYAQLCSPGRRICASSITLQLSALLSADLRVQYYKERVVLSFLKLSIHTVQKPRIIKSRTGSDLVMVENEMCEVGLKTYLQCKSIILKRELYVHDGGDIPVPTAPRTLSRRETISLRRALESPGRG